MPGFRAESVPLYLMRLARRIDRRTASETLMYAKYPSAYQMFDLMGFGFAPDDPTPVFANTELVGETWRHLGMLMADVLGLPIDRIECFRNVAVTKRALQVAAGTIGAGTVGAMNFGVRVISEGRASCCSISPAWRPTSRPSGRRDMAGGSIWKANPPSTPGSRSVRTA